MKTLTVALAGLGSRGKDTYAPMAKQIPDKLKIAAIADIDRDKVNAVKEEYGVADHLCFSSAEEMLAAGKVADVIFIATQDRQHADHAIPALRLGYDLLLEKPISPDLDECREIMQVAKENGRKVVICHVLRYTPYFSRLKEILDSNIIGNVVSIIAIENVGYWHQAHSFVRGNWRNSRESSPMILQKCCHDMDLYLWLCGKTCERVSSYGGTYLFRKECAPSGASDYCLQGCRAKVDCLFDAEKIYVTNEKTGVNHKTGWPLGVVALHPTRENIYEAIRSGPYGRCVYRCDNDVVDHQVVNLNMTDGSTMSFTMCGFTEENSRWARFMGTKGEILAPMHDNLIRIMPFGGKEEIVDLSPEPGEDRSGHAGGDNRLVKEFVEYILTEKSHFRGITTLEQSMESHYVAFAAEQSRKHHGESIALDSFRCP